MACAWHNVTEREAARWRACPLLADGPISVARPQTARFRCDVPMLGKSGWTTANPLRRWTCTRGSDTRTDDTIRGLTRTKNVTFFFLGDSIAEQAAKAMACKFWRHLHAAGQQPLMERRDERWFALDLRRPHHERGPPWCVRVAGRHQDQQPQQPQQPQQQHHQHHQHHLHQQQRVCFLSAWPTVLELASLLAASPKIVRRGDALVVNENMARGEAVALASMRAFAAEAANASTRLGRAHAAGIRLLWREKSPQTFSDSPVGSYQHLTYGSPYQHCAVPNQTARSPAVETGLAALEAAGVAPIRIWDETITQADQYLASRTPYVAAKLDCTHFCEPSGALEMWTDATLRALAAPVAGASAGAKSMTETRCSTL